MEGYDEWLSFKLDGADMCVHVRCKKGFYILMSPCFSPHDEVRRWKCAVLIFFALRTKVMLIQSGTEAAAAATIYAPS
jgi:hypothetical protein